MTLTGPGGVGKTRLALAAAARLHEAFPHGGYFVPLAPVRDADVMWKTIAGSLDVTGDEPAADVVTQLPARTPRPAGSGQPRATGRRRRRWWPRCWRLRRSW